MSKRFVLHSGGLDSSVCIAIALESPNCEIISYSADYGQRHIKELEYAKRICSAFGIEHRTFQIPEMSSSMLTDPSRSIPDVSYDDLPHGISPTYVPFRNGLLLSRLASIAQAEKADVIYFGAHAEDAQNYAYPDCTPEFIEAMKTAIFIGTYDTVTLWTPLMNLMKKDIVEWGDRLKVPFELTWSCYKGEELHCGVCPTCRARRQAFIDAEVKDPTEYAQ